MWLRFVPHTWCHAWVEFVVGFRPSYANLSPGPLVFLPPQKPTFQRRATSTTKSHNHLIIIIIIIIVIVIILKKGTKLNITCIHSGRN